MSIDAKKKILSIALLIAAPIFGAAILDGIAYRQQADEFSEAIETRFIQQSLKVGAWVMDREYVAEWVGIDVDKLPSHQIQQQEDKPQ
jgi:hypothetical protein